MIFLEEASLFDRVFKLGLFLQSNSEKGDEVYRLIVKCEAEISARRTELIGKLKESILDLNYPLSIANMSNNQIDRLILEANPYTLKSGSGPFSVYKQIAMDVYKIQIEKAKEVNKGENLKTETIKQWLFSAYEMDFWTSIKHHLDMPLSFWEEGIDSVHNIVYSFYRLMLVRAVSDSLSAITERYVNGN